MLRIRQRHGFYFSSEFSTSPLRAVAMITPIFMRFRGTAGPTGQRCNFSSETMRGYLGAFERVPRYFGNPPDLSGPDHIREYQAHLLYQRNWQSVPK